MFNQKVIATLGQILNLTNSAIVKFPVTVFRNEAKNVLLKLNIEKLDPDKFDTFGLADSLNRFVSAFKILGDEKSVTLNKNIFNISDCKSSIQFLTDEPCLITDYDLNDEIFTKISSSLSVAEFDLSINDIKQLKNARAIFSDLDCININANENISMSLCAPSKFNARSNSFSIVKDVQTSKQFDFIFSVDVLSQIPLCNYKCSIKYNSNKNRYRLFMIGDLNEIEILIAPKN